jgi:hypothetical protein
VTEGARVQQDEQPTTEGCADSPPASRGTDLSIYAALLGRQVRIDPDATKPEKGVEIRFTLHSSIKLGGTREHARSPIQAGPNWLDHVGQWIANAVHAFERARQRVMRPKALRDASVGTSAIAGESSPTTVETSVIVPAASARNSSETSVTPSATLMHHKPVIFVGPAVLKHRSRSKAHAA